MIEGTSIVDTLTDIEKAAFANLNIPLEQEQDQWRRHVEDIVARSFAKNSAVYLEKLKVVSDSDPATAQELLDSVTQAARDVVAKQIIGSVPLPDPPVA